LLLTVREYGVPSEPPGSDVVVIVSAGATVIVSAFVELEPTLSTAWMVKPGAPAVAGVPVMAPLAELRLSPPGSDPAETDQVSGAVPPEETTVVE
jgi:hypothetical protein